MLLDLDNSVLVILETIQNTLVKLNLCHRLGVRFSNFPLLYISFLPSDRTNVSYFLNNNGAELSHRVLFIESNILYQQHIGITTMIIFMLQTKNKSINQSIFCIRSSTAHIWSGLQLLLSSVSFLSGFSTLPWTNAIGVG